MSIRSLHLLHFPFYSLLLLIRVYPRTHTASTNPDKELLAMVD
jgi:hypothetical protein